jgi:hypothetical protein
LKLEGDIISIVNNGQCVKQGSILAKLNKTEFQQKVQQAQTALEKASGEAFCTLIDDSQFEVSFQVLETELSEIQLNMGVKVVPFSLEDVTARYTHTIFRGERPLCTLVNTNNSFYYCVTF